MMVFLNNETAAMLMSQINPVRVEPYSQEYKNFLLQ